MVDHINNNNKKDRKIHILSNQIEQNEVKIGCLEDQLYKYKKIFIFLVVVNIAIILFLGDVGGYKSLIYKYSIATFISNEAPSNSLYDVIIDCKTFGSIGEGWNLTHSNTDFYKKFKNLEENYESTVVVLGGGSNSDKRFILNEIEETNFNSSFGHDTPLLAFYQPTKNPMIVYLNTMGWNRLISSSQDNEEHSNRIYSIDTTYDTISNTLGNVFIDVVGKNQDMCKSVNYLEPKVGKTHLVIHNYKYTDRVEQVEKFIFDDITNKYIGGKKESVNITRDCEFWSINGTYHFVMAKKGSEAGNKYNNCTINFIKQIVDDRGKHAVIKRNKKVNNLLGEIINLTSKKLSDSYKKCIDINWSSSRNRESIKWHHNNMDSSKFIVTDNKIKLYHFYSNVHEFDYGVELFTLKNSFSISINTSSSKVYWVCQKEYKNKIYAIIDKLPQQQTDKQDDFDSTFGLIIKGFDLPINISVDCEIMVKNAIYKEGITFIEIDNGNFTTIGSPKLLNKLY